MKNRELIVAVGIFALMLAACGSGDVTEGGNDGATDPGGSNDAGTVNPDDTATCGNGVCETGEGCSSCENDCACTAEYTACRSNACVDWDTINPLLKKLPGHWVAVEPPNEDDQDVTVDTLDPDCHDGLIAQGYDPNPNPNEPGDACVKGFQPGRYVLHGSSLRIVYPNSMMGGVGQVLNDGTRVELTTTGSGGDVFPTVYEHQ